jgi:hypothetical protein
LNALTDEEAITISRQVINILDDWEIGTQDKILILGLYKKVPVRSFNLLGKSKALPMDSDGVEIIKQIVAIDEALSTTYPMNSQVARLWLHRPHRRFKKRTPIKTMIEEGINGLIKVHAHLDCAYAWELSEG